MNTTRTSVYSIMQNLLNQGADINAQNSYQDTALHVAVRNENTELVKFLLKNNIDVNIQDCGGLTAPECALRINSNLAILLIESGKISLDVLKKMKDCVSSSELIILESEKVLKSIETAIHKLEPTVNERKWESLKRLFLN